MGTVTLWRPTGPEELALVGASGVGYVTRFDVVKGHLDRYDVQRVGGETILDYWIPAEDLGEFNRHIIGLIEVVREFR